MTCPPPVTVVVISVDNGCEALAEFSGFLDKAPLSQWRWSLANHRGNILIFLGFNSFNYIYCEFSNQWVYQCAKKNRSCVCKINFTGYQEAPVNLSAVNLELVTWAESNYHLYRLEIRTARGGMGPGFELPGRLAGFVCPKPPRPRGKNGFCFATVSHEELLSEWRKILTI